MGVVVPLSAAEAKEASLAPLLKLVAPDMEKVNAQILSYADSHVELIPQLAQHLIDSGGKRLRPMLTIAAARMCGYGYGTHHVELATAAVAVPARGPVLRRQLSEARKRPGLASRNLARAP